MSGLPILSLITFLPLAGAFLIFLLRGSDKSVAANARLIALITSLGVFAVSIYMYAGFDKVSGDFQFVEKHDWLPGFNIAYKLGVDGISVFFILLSTLLTPICVLAS